MKRAQAVMNLHEIAGDVSYGKKEDYEPKMKRIALRVDESGDFALPVQEVEDSPAVRSVLIPYIDDSISERDLYNSVNKLGDVQEVLLFRGAVTRAIVVFARKETAVTVADRSLITVRGCTYFVDSVTEGAVVATEDTVFATEDTVFATEGAVIATEDTVVATEDTVAAIVDAVVATEDTVVATEDTAVAIVDAVVATEDTVAATEDAVSATEEPFPSVKIEYKIEDSEA